MGGRTEAALAKTQDPAGATGRPVEGHERGLGIRASDRPGGPCRSVATGCVGRGLSDPQLPHAMDRPSARTDRSIVALGRLAAVLVACAANNLLSGAEVRSWQTALAGMPLPAPAPLLNRDNAVCLLLDAFRSNDLV